MRIITGLIASIGTAVTVVGVLDALGQAPPRVPSFEVVSIRQSPPDRPGAFPQASFDQRPDGGIAVTNHTVASLIARAYPPTRPVEIVGLPEWARRDHYNVTA